MSIELTQAVAAPAKPAPAAAGAGDLLPTSPDWTSISSVTPFIVKIVGLLAALGAAVGIVVFFWGLVVFATAGKDEERNDTGTMKMKRGGIAFFVGGVVGLALLRIGVNLATGVTK